MTGLNKWRAMLRVLLPALLLAVNAWPAESKTASNASFYQWDNLDPSIPSGTLLRQAPMKLPPFYRAKAWRILYMTRDYAGRPIVSSGMVVLSGYAAANPAERDIVAWAHPTTGVARKCAPTMRKSPVEAIVGFNELITGGFIVAATDYPGLGTRGPVGYLVGIGQARATIDAARAARQIDGVGGSGRFALWGYSQGAHAALFAAQLAKDYAPEMSLIGVAATAPPTDLRTLLAANINTVPGRILASMTLQSWNVKYGAPLSSLVDDEVTRIVGAVASNCVDDLGSKLDALAAQRPLEDRFLTADPGKTKPWSSLIQSNSIFQMPSGVPLFIAQGEADEIVRPEVTLRFARNACRNGNRVNYLSMPGADHTRSAKESAPQAINWIRERFAGAAAPSSCR